MFKLYIQLDKDFSSNMTILWPNLARFNNLLVIVNISMFFLSGLVAQGYYYTFYSLGCLMIVALLHLLPVLYIRKLWYYLLCLTVEFTGLYFLLASVIYWVRTSNGT